MAISKPSWLRSALSYLNWDIFTWHVYVGDAIESAIDWAVDWLNWAIAQATLAYNKAVAAWDKAVEVGKAVWGDFLLEIDKVWSNIETWWSDLGDWWSTKVTWIKDRIAAATEGLDKLKVAWDNFWTQTFPTLISKTWLGEWWLGRSKEVDESTDTKFAEHEWFWAGWSDVRDNVVTFFTNPLEWLWLQFTDWFLGKEK